MSINWVMTSPNETGFVKLPNERILYTSPPRTHLQISTPNTYPGAEPFSAKSEAGVVYITNQRIVYLPSTSTPELQSFSAPILHLQDTYVRAPFFGANYWVALCKPVPGGGIPPNNSAVELRLTFREGGAFDFHSTFEQIKERLHHAYTMARESGRQNVVDVDLEQLPAYEPAREVESEDEGPRILSPVPTRPQARDSGAADALRNPTETSPPNFTAPDEPPPGYEEAQAQAVGIDLDQRLREAAERQRDSDVSP
ncbi:hypothetical protein N431DRAFT_33206 [Stipitochalara longipes BDJ]|nr:hypothetical protein N431DRAFT_33206 [Stipitochalara longipes BDJ]